MNPITTLIGTAALAAVQAATWLAPDAAASKRSPTFDPVRGATDVAGAAARIDELLEAHWSAQGLRGGDIVDDHAFARRAHLHLAGRVPTVEELRAFVADRNRDKRPELIATLVRSPAHQSRMYAFWADLLRVVDRLGNQVSGAPYEHFVKQALADNMPYDAFVRELLSAEGPAMQRGNGATGYLMRDRGMPEDNMANTMRVFLGTRIECAQCHNHPFDHWTQQDFVRLVAFQGGVQYVHGDARARGRELIQAGRALRDQNQQAYRIFRGLTRGMAAGISGSGTGLARLPKDYAYEDARPNAILTAEAPFGPAPELDIAVPAERPARRGRRRSANRGRNRDNFPEADSRSAFAAWVSSAENDRFAQVIANRLWKLVMGRGLIEPVDDIRDDTLAADPELMAFLTQLVVDSGFDLRFVLEAICSTTAWQREAQAEPAPGVAAIPTGPIIQRMTAEQAWDSLLVLRIGDADGTLTAPGFDAEAIYEQYDRVAQMSVDDILAEARSGRRIRPQNPRLAQRQKLREEARALGRQLAQARRQRDAERTAALREQIDALRQQLSAGGGLVRASELPNPAPDGHFLRNFGQSDRQQIEASSREANVPQALNLMNGLVDEAMAKGSAIQSALGALDQPAAKITHAFEAILGRPPTSRERREWLSDVRRFGDEAITDLVWVLLQTHEFLFIG